MITEDQYLEAQKIVNAYTKQLKQAIVSGSAPRFRCLLCGRNKFDRKQPHKCVGGYRKRGLKWEKVEVAHLH